MSSKVEVLRSDEDPSIRGLALTVRFNCGLVISHVILIAVLPAPAKALGMPVCSGRRRDSPEALHIYLLCHILA
jgi:hypothetical protein